MKRIIILNGPNLNLLGKREVDIYGSQDFLSFFDELTKQHTDAVTLEYFQSNHEGEIIDKIHEVGFFYDGIILNPGALTHTSIAIADALAAITCPAIEVHISNIHARETFRHKSFTAAQATGLIAGLGYQGYALALQYLLKA
jgi:3-dehydroquinate dehydratase-2